MREFQPVGHVIGRLTAALGLAMLLPAAVDLVDGQAGWRGIAVAAFLTMAGGTALAVLNARDRGRAMSRHQAITSASVGLVSGVGTTNAMPTSP